MNQCITIPAGQFKINSLKDLSTLKELVTSFNQKLNYSALGKRLGIDRRTAKKYSDGFSPKEGRERPSKIDPLYPILEELLSNTCMQRFSYIRVLWQYMCDQFNLDVTYGTFRHYIHKHSNLLAYFKSGKPTEPSTPVLRYESHPAEQAQFDWKEDIAYTTRDGEVFKIQVFVMKLSYSRYVYTHLTLQRSQLALIDAIVKGFEHFGGVPKELLTDNMKTVMKTPNYPGQKGELTDAMKNLCKEFNVKIKSCKSRRPCTKGKVETFMKILEEIHAYNGKLSLLELEDLLEKITRRYNHSISQATGKLPVRLFEKEKSLLSPLPCKRLRDSFRINSQDAKAGTDCLVSYKGAKYSVPPAYRCKKLRLERVGEYLHIYDNTKLIARHQIVSKKYQIKYAEDHYLEITRHNSLYLDENESRNWAIENLERIKNIYDE